MFKLNVVVNGNVFSVDADVPAADVWPRYDAWVALLPPTDAAQIESITANLKAENDRETTLVHDNAGT